MNYSENPINAVEAMAEKFGFYEVPVDNELVEYRVGLLKEEFKETIDAHAEGDAEKVVDGHIDLIVIAVGNLSMMGVDVHTAFDEVMKANMAKERRKRSETDPDGASIAKPEGWQPPDHSNNHGVLDEIYRQRDSET